MGFVKTQQELDNYFARAVREFPDARMLGILYETDPEIVARVLPAPLEPTPEPWVLSFIAEYPVTNLGPGYHEGAIFVRCRYRGEVGNYCISMPVTDEARMHNGRDIYGFPKKLADIGLVREGSRVEGWIERRGRRFVNIRAELEQKLDEPPLQVGPNFLFKYAPAADLGRGFDGPVLLVRQKTEVNPTCFEMGRGEISFERSEDDPWAELEVRNVITAYFMTTTNRMLPAEVVGEADPEAFLPHAFNRTDFFGG